MGRKILGWIVLILLLAGSVCGIVFGIKYDDVNNKMNASSEKIAYVDELEEERIKLLEQITNLENDNNIKTDEIEMLEYQLEYIEALLEAFRTSDKLAVAFYIDNELDKVVLVSANGKVDTTSISSPTKEGYTFKGWALKGTVEIVDLSNYSIVEDVIFDAVFEVNV